MGVAGLNEEEDGKFAMATPPPFTRGGCMKRRRREKFTATPVGVRISSNEEEEEEGTLQPPIGGSELTLAVWDFLPTDFFNVFNSKAIRKCSEALQERALLF
mgnify:CR=1 FL=1